jgi:hypothetical protein
MRHAMRAEKTKHPERWNLIPYHGIDLPVEWFPYLFLALRKMERHAARETGAPWIVQIKSKRNSLRIYYRHYGKRRADPEMDAIIEDVNHRLREKGLLQ